LHAAKIRTVQNSVSPVSILVLSVIIEALVETRAVEHKYVMHMRKNKNRI
jgi:hypothetical protein